MLNEKLVLKEGLDLLNILTTNYLNDENNFLIFEETVFPALPGRTVNRKTFRNFRNVLAQRVSKSPPVNPILQLENLNSSITLQKQTQNLDTLTKRNFDLRKKIDDLQQDINNTKHDFNIKINSLSEKLDDDIRDINSKLDQILTILNIVKHFKDDLEKSINSNFNDLNDYLSVTDKKMIERFNGLSTDIKTFNELLITQIKKHVDTNFKQLSDFFENIINNVNSKIDNTTTILKDYVFNQLFSQTSDLESYVFATLTAELGSQTLNINAATSGITAAQTAGLEGSIVYSSKVTNGNIEKIKTKINNFLTNELDTRISKILSDWYKDNENKILKSSSSFICKRIVGESYIKYDANYTYMPTIILKYKTKNFLNERKYSQIKLRLNYKTEEITDALIKTLKLQIQDISSINYVCGNLRCNYVGEKRLFKTTVFSNSKETVLNLFERLIPLTNTKYLKENFSFTENSRRNHNLKIKNPLLKIKINKSNDFSETTMELSSAYLQINGLENQIELF